MPLAPETNPTRAVQLPPAPPELGTTGGGEQTVSSRAWACPWFGSSKLPGSDEEKASRVCWLAQPPSTAVHHHPLVFFIFKQPISSVHTYSIDIAVGDPPNAAQNPPSFDESQEPSAADSKLRGMKGLDTAKVPAGRPGPAAQWRREICFLCPHRACAHAASRASSRTHGGAAPGSGATASQGTQQQDWKTQLGEMRAYTRS